MKEPMLLELTAPINIIGDIHGHYQNLHAGLASVGGPPTSSNSSTFLFLGDYVDRGNQGIKTMCYLLALKLKYPKRIWLLRGNHEVDSITRIYGFYDEVKKSYKISLWKSFCSMF